MLGPGVLCGLLARGAAARRVGGGAPPLLVALVRGLARASEAGLRPQQPLDQDIIPKV
jgi:hypothetical protein